MKKSEDPKTLRGQRAFFLLPFIPLKIGALAAAGAAVAAATAAAATAATAIGGAATGAAGLAAPVLGDVFYEGLKTLTDIFEDLGM